MTSFCHGPGPKTSARNNAPRESTQINLPAKVNIAVKGCRQIAHQTNYIYDGFDRLKQTVYADATSDQVTQYDNDNNALTRVNRAGSTLTYTYDALDRMWTKAVPAIGSIAANTVTWTYDLANKVTQIGDTLGNTLVNGYDPAGRQTSATNTAPGMAAKTINYQVDNAGNRTQLTWPDNYSVTYSFDAANRMYAANENGSTPLATYDYDNLGHRAWVQYGSGAPAAKVSYSWSNEGDLLTLSHALAQVANSVGFIDDYTPAHQINSSQISNPAYQYALTGSVIANYAPVNGLNQYPTITPAGGSATSILYDANGNLTSDGNFTFAYDPENRLMTATKTGTSVAYAYDPLGRRTTKTVNGSATYFLDSGDDEIAEYDATGNNVLRRFVPGPGIDQPIAMVSCSGINCAIATKSLLPSRQDRQRDRDVGCKRRAVQFS